MFLNVQSCKPFSKEYMNKYKIDFVSAQRWLIQVKLAFKNPMPAVDADQHGEKSVD